VDHATTTRTIYDQINSGDIDGFGEHLADDVVEHEELPGLEPTKAGVLDFFRGLRAAFPDLHMEVQDLIADDGKVVARVVVTGTQEGEFFGVPASGRHVEVDLIDIMRFDASGHVCEHWGVTDTLSLMQQIGAVPTGPA